jgi:hypothetical protein
MPGGPMAAGHFCIFNYIARSLMPGKVHHAAGGPWLPRHNIVRKAYARVP